MPRFAHQQQDAKSCGAATAMVALAEFGNIPAASVNNATEAQIWHNVRNGPQPNPNPAANIGGHNAHPNETSVAFLANFLIGNGRAVQIIEDTAKTGAIRAVVPAMDGPYRHYRAQLDVTGQQTHLLQRSVNAGDFNNNARIFLVVILPSYLTHYVLARRDGLSYFVMNPDGATDTQQAQLVPWLTGGWQAQQQIGNVNYWFSGICVRAT